MCYIGGWFFIKGNSGLKMLNFGRLHLLSLDVVVYKFSDCIVFEQCPQKTNSH